MSKFTRLVTVFTALFLALIMITACGQGTQDLDIQAGNPFESSDQAVLDSTAEPSTSEEPETLSEEAPGKPSEPDGSSLHQSYDLQYSLPDWMLAMKYNGMLGVYEFYTGDFNGSPTGLDFAVEVYSDSELKGESLETYVLTRSRAKAAGLTAIERVTYNGFEWLRLTDGVSAAYYYAVFNEGLYCLLALQGNDTAENYLTARNMLEQTLYFEIEE